MSAKLKVYHLLAALLLGMGLAGPCMTIHPSFGEFNELIRIFRPSFTEPTSYSVFGGIMALMRDGKWFLGAFVFLFSVVFPAVKLVVLWKILLEPSLFAEQSRLHRWTDRLGKFSMVDVFVMALLVLALKGLPGGSSISLGWGLAAFAAAALITMDLAWRVRKQERQPGRLAN